MCGRGDEISVAIDIQGEADSCPYDRVGELGKVAMEAPRSKTERHRPRCADGGSSSVGGWADHGMAGLDARDKCGEVIGSEERKIGMDHDPWLIWGRRHPGGSSFVEPTARFLDAIEVEVFRPELNIVVGGHNCGGDTDSVGDGHNVIGQSDGEPRSVSATEMYGQAFHPISKRSDGENEPDCHDARLGNNGSGLRVRRFMARAVWNGTVIAESDETVIVEGNHYFPPDAVKKEYFDDSSTHTRCFWKGKASYYDVVVDGERNADAAWYYPDPSKAASEIKDHVAFWRGVKVEV